MRRFLKRGLCRMMALVTLVSLLTGAVFCGPEAKAARPKEPPQVKGLKIRQSARGGLDVYFNRAKNVAGYRVQFDTSPRFTHPSRVNTSSTRVHLMARKGRTYYVRVLAFVYDSRRRRVLGKYTKAVKVKVKK